MHMRVSISHVPVNYNWNSDSQCQIEGRFHSSSPCLIIVGTQIHKIDLSVNYDLVYVRSKLELEYTREHLLSNLLVSYNCNLDSIRFR